MKVVAIRGVCIGPERHLAPGEKADLDEQTAKFLQGIGAVEKVDTPKPEAETPAPVKSGKKEK